ncbi:hypothetical protein C8R43DRAFT_1139885 [Mycena crocata]|nr:hypothetical protein C8R43DRAFT_1139885 [Mycena crocata]
MDFRKFPARSTHAGMIRPVAETTERTPSPSPTRSGNAPSVGGTPAASSPLPQSSPPHRAASSPVRDDEEDEQDHQQDDDEDEHDDEQGQEQEQEVDEQEQHESQDVDMEDLVDSGSEDDYAATREAEDRQLKKARATPSWLPIETTQEEDDEEDNREFEAEVDGQRVVNRKGPPKRKAADSVEDDDGEQGGTEEEEEEEEEEEYKAGPIDKGSVNLLFRWKEELEEKVEELAREIRKPASSLWALILPTHKETRAKTGWNMWQAWLYTPKERGGGGQRPDPSLSKKEQAHQDREKLREELPADVRHLATRSDIVFKNLPWLVEWNSKMEAELLADRQSSGAMLRGVAATAKEFTKLCEVAEKELDLHVLGSIISTNGGSCAFGSSKAVKMYKQRHHVEEKKNLTTMEAHIRVLKMEIDGASAAEILKAQQVMSFPSQMYAKASAAVKRDGERSWLKDRLLDDICSIEVARNVIKPEDVANTRAKMLMKWAAWADYAFEKKLRLENWDDGMAAAGHIPKAGFKVTWFEKAELARVIPAMEARFGLPDADEEDAEDSMRVVSWSEEEIRSSLVEQGDIALLTTLKGTVALRGSDSPKYVLAAQKEEKAKERTERGRGAAKVGKAKKHGRAHSSSPAASSPERSPSRTRERASRRRSASPVRGPARSGRSGRRESPSRERRRGSPPARYRSPRSPPPRRRSRTASPTPRPARRRSPDAAPARHPPGSNTVPQQPRPVLGEKRRLLQIAKHYLLEGEEEGASKVELSKFCFVRGSSDAREFSPQFYGRLREDNAGTRVPRETFCRVRSADYPDGGWKRMGKDCTIEFLSVDQLQIFKKYRERWELL